LAPCRKLRRTLVLSGRSKGRLMDVQGNGQPPGYQAPIFNAMNDDQLVVYVPRPILCAIVLLCVGVGVLSRSWGAALLYLVLHGLAAYLTYRDPRWLQVLKEALSFRYRLYRLHYRPAAWRVRVRLAWVSLAAGVILVYTLSLFTDY
jgi:type IV secretory pathway TrbD component